MEMGFSTRLNEIAISDDTVVSGCVIDEHLEGGDSRLC